MPDKADIPPRLHPRLGTIKTYLRAQENHTKGKGLYCTLGPLDKQWQSAGVLHCVPFPQLQVLGVPYAQGSCCFFPKQKFGGVPSRRLNTCTETE